MKIIFSRSQFLISDANADRGSFWTEEHFDQGFARRADHAGFRTLLEFGEANVRVHLSKYVSSPDYQRAIEVPFNSATGRIAIGGVEEYPDLNIVDAPQGEYRLTVAQRSTGNLTQCIDIFLEAVIAPVMSSHIIVRDAELHPPDRLLESAEYADSSAG